MWNQNQAEGVDESEGLALWYYDIRDLNYNLSKVRETAMGPKDVLGRNTLHLTTVTSKVVCYGAELKGVKHTVCE